jgi:hypothetical protein
LRQKAAKSLPAISLRQTPARFGTKEIDMSQITAARDEDEMLEEAATNERVLSASARSLEETVNSIKGFLSRTAAAHKVMTKKRDADLGTGKWSDSDERDLLHAFRTILDLNEQIPVFVKEFKANSGKFASFVLPFKMKTWTSELDDVSKDAAQLPKKVESDPQVADKWLERITKPMRSIMRELDKAAVDERRRALSAPTTKEQKKAPMVPVPRPLSFTSPPSGWQSQLSDAIKKNYPQLSDSLGIPNEKHDEKTERWVDQQIGSIKKTDRKLLDAVTPGVPVLVDNVSVLVQGFFSERGMHQMEKCGIKAVFTMGWLNIQNAAVIATDNPKKFMAEYMARARAAKSLTEEAFKVRTCKLVPVSPPYKYRGITWHLLLPEVVAQDTDVTQWNFSI